ncbi:MAG: hypothetical protein IKK57_07445 [Clostridia bacterium]|nr:hypothetical protein [Clostridia bacterium]
MKKAVLRTLKWLGLMLLTALVLTVAFRFLYARNWRGTAHAPQTLDVPWSCAAADGVISPEEIALHYAPQIDQAVNVLLSSGGRGDFITAVNYDGDWSCLNNWDNLRAGDLGAVVYYSVQETDTHYYVGYHFYHPRDDAEIWLDRHENDMEGIILAVPKATDAWLPPEYMYTQGHGKVYFYLSSDDTPKMLHGSTHAGQIALTEDGRPWIYITPNGTLSNCGHSVESAAGHSTYWSVGNSGVRYVPGGEAQTPRTWNGPFRQNACSYALQPLQELWQRRHGPYNGTGTFGSYGAFDGDNWGEDKANPPWAWRNKTVYGFGGSFLSDPVWTLNHAIAGADLSAAYVRNGFADWRVSVQHVHLPDGVTPADCTLHLFQDTWEISAPSWFTLTEADGLYRVTMGESGREAIFVAAHAGAQWRMEVHDHEGNRIPGAHVTFTASRVIAAP